MMQQEKSLHNNLLACVLLILSLVCSKTTTAQDILDTNKAAITKTTKMLWFGVILNSGAKIENNFWNTELNFYYGYSKTTDKLKYYGASSIGNIRPQLGFSLRKNNNNLGASLSYGRNYYSEQRASNPAESYDYVDIKHQSAELRLYYFREFFRKKPFHPIIGGSLNYSLVNLKFDNNYGNAAGMSTSYFVNKSEKILSSSIKLIGSVGLAANLSKKISFRMLLDFDIFMYVRGTYEDRTIYTGYLNDGFNTIYIDGEETITTESYSEFMIPKSIDSSNRDENTYTLIPKYKFPVVNLSLGYHF